MPNPNVTSIELSTGDIVPLSFDLETGTPVEITLYGTDLQDLQDIEIDSGEDVTWLVTGVSASSNTFVVTAYATGMGGWGYVAPIVAGRQLIVKEDTAFELPLMD